MVCVHSASPENGSLVTMMSPGRSVSMPSSSTSPRTFWHTDDVTPERMG